MSAMDKPLVWLGGEIKTPPFSREARIKAGILLRALQQGHGIPSPDSSPMKTIGRGCHELRIDDGKVTWRVMYWIAPDAIVILEVFQKTTQKTPQRVIDVCRQRLKSYNSDI